MLLGAGPAVFLHLAGLHEGIAPLLVHVLVVEREVEGETPVEVGATEVEAGTDHTDFVAHAQAAATGEKVRIFLVAGDFIGEEVIDDDRFAPGVEQALAAD